MYRLAALAGVTAAAACALLAAGLGPGPSASAAGNCTVADVSNDAEELAFLSILNSYRADHGVRQLRLAPALNRAAEWMAQDMIAHGYFGHVDSLGRDPFVRTMDCGYPIAGGENLAGGTNRGSAQGAFDLFRGSPSHNENMLAPEYREIGIARVYGPGSQYGWYWATTFGSSETTVQQPVSPEPTMAPPQPPTPPPPPSMVDIARGAQSLTWTGNETAPEALLAGHEDAVAALWGKSETGAWAFFIPALPDFLNTLEAVEPGEAILVLASQPAQISLDP